MENFKKIVIQNRQKALMALEKLEQKKISTDEAKAAAALLKQMNVAVSIRVEAIKMAKVMEQYDTIFDEQN